MTNHSGKIIIASDVNVWPHELETAKALATAGMTVEFIRKSEERYTTSADVLIDGIQWEMKAPKSDKLKVVQKNLRLALHQSENVIFDSRRMKRIPDKAVERELRKWGGEIKSVEHLGASCFCESPRLSSSSKTCYTFNQKSTGTVSISPTSGAFSMSRKATCRRRCPFINFIDL